MKEQEWSICKYEYRSGNFYRKHGIRGLRLEYIERKTLFRYLCHMSVLSTRVTIFHLYLTKKLHGEISRIILQLPRFNTVDLDPTSMSPLFMIVFHKATCSVKTISRLNWLNQIFHACMHHFSTF